MRTLNISFKIEISDNAHCLALVNLVPFTLMSFFSRLCLATFKHRFVPLTKTFCSENKGQNCIMFAVRSQFDYFVHGEVMRKRDIACMTLPPKRFFEYHCHSSHVAQHLVIRKKSLTLSQGLVFDAVECGCGKAHNCLFTCIYISTFRNHLHWLNAIFDLRNWSVQLNQGINVLPFTLLIKYSLCSLLQVLADTQHTFSQSEAINIGVLETNVEFNIGERLLAVFKQLQYTVLSWMTALQSGCFLSKQIGQIFISHLLFDVIISRDIVIFVIECLELFLFFRSDSLFSLLMSEIFEFVAQMLQ